MVASVISRIEEMQKRLREQEWIMLMSKSELASCSRLRTATKILEM